MFYWRWLAQENFQRLSTLRYLVFWQLSDDDWTSADCSKYRTEIRFGHESKILKGGQGNVDTSRITIQLKEDQRIFHLIIFWWKILDLTDKISLKGFQSNPRWKNTLPVKIETLIKSNKIRVTIFKGPNRSQSTIDFLFWAVYKYASLRIWYFTSCNIHWICLRQIRRCSNRTYRGGSTSQCDTRSLGEAH